MRVTRSVVLAAAVLAGCTSATPPVERPPDTRVAEVVDTIHGERFADPYRWLEDQAAPETRVWLAAQSAYADRVLPRDAARLALPSFTALSAAWVEAGGVYALAILRGGSEFGEAWHRAGMLTGKPRGFENFIAASEWLIAERYASPATLGIRGTSNGGLLVGAALTRRPDLYRAVLCGFPDIDILRFNQFTSNNNMPVLLEYGDAAEKAEFDVIKTYSPYQQVKPATAYPAVLVSSGDLDTRVPPLAARKFTARLQAATSSGRPVILRYHPKAGHAADRGLPFSLRVQETTAELAFMMRELGLTAAAP